MKTSHTLRPESKIIQIFNMKNFWHFFSLNREEGSPYVRLLTTQTGTFLNSGVTHTVSSLRNEHVELGIHFIYSGFMVVTITKNNNSNNTTTNNHWIRHCWKHLSFLSSFHPHHFNTLDRL